MGRVVAGKVRKARRKARARPNNSWQDGKRTDGKRSRQFMQPLPQVNAASDTLRYADLKALLDSVCPPFAFPFSCP